MILEHKDIEYIGAEDRPALLDLYYRIDVDFKMPVVIFMHGYKGFKDWGHWDLIAQTFAQAGCFFIKFNVSHNGTTVEDAIEFTDLEAFGQNNYTKEWKDIDAILDFIENQDYLSSEELDFDRLTMIGHSRGGGMALVKAAADHRIQKLLTWASVDRLDYAWQQPGFIEKWKMDGIYHVINGRTKQEMPHLFSFYENFMENKERLNTQKAAAQLKKPWLIIHGDNDPAVKLQAAQQLQAWQAQAELFVIPGGDHVFGGSHPYNAENLHPQAQLLVEKSIDFVLS